MNTALTMPVPGDWPDFLPGWVWLVGAGPGDAGLLTLHGLNALRQADVVVYDALVGEAVLEWARPGAMIEYAGKRGGKPSPQQRDISLKLIDHAREGRRVLRLKGGDPFVFGRGGEEAQTLAEAGVPFRIVPGISAGIGGLAYAGIPVTHRDVNQSVTFVTGHDASGNAPSAVDWHGLAKSSPVIVCYMSMKTLPRIVASLLEGGRAEDEPVAVVTNATLPQQTVLESRLGRVVDEVQAANLEPPAIICIGRVALMRQTLDWMGQLAGKAPRSLDPLGVRGTSEREVS